MGASHPPSMASLSVEDVYEQIVKEVMQGADGTDIKCGVIGEIGCSWPLTGKKPRSCYNYKIASGILHGWIICIFQPTTSKLPKFLLVIN